MRTADDGSKRCFGCDEPAEWTVQVVDSTSRVRTHQVCETGTRIAYEAKGDPGKADEFLTHMAPHRRNDHTDKVAKQLCDPDRKAWNGWSIKPNDPPTPGRIELEFSRDLRHKGPSR